MEITPVGDITELNAVKKTFGENVQDKLNKIFIGTSARGRIST